MSDYNDKVIEEFRASGGKAESFGKMNLLLLTTTGAKSGTSHTAPLAYTRDGDSYVVAASYGGAPKNPAWYHNVLAHPEVTLEVGAEKFQATARIADPEERDKLYAAHADEYATFHDYEAKTDRKIPIIIFKRA